MEEIAETEHNEKKKNKKYEDSLRDQWNYFKCNNIQIIGVLEEEDEENGMRKYLRRL